MSDQLSEFHPRERTEGDSYKPSEHIGALMIVKVNEHKHIDSTIHKPEGGPAIVADVCDLTAGGVFRDVLWMNGAVVDELRPWLGKRVVVKFLYTKSQKGTDYITVVPASPEELRQAQQMVSQRGDPFAAPMGTTAPPPPPPPAYVPPTPWDPSPAPTSVPTTPPPWAGATGGTSTSNTGAQPPFATDPGDPWAPPPPEEQPPF